MTELRDEIAAVLLGDDYYSGYDEAAERLAAEILAIPEIAEALKLKQEHDRLNLGPGVGTGPRGKEVG